MKKSGRERRQWGFKKQIWTINRVWKNFTHEKTWAHYPLITQDVVCRACPHRCTNQAPPQLNRTVLGCTLELCKPVTRINMYLFYNRPAHNEQTALTWCQVTLCSYLQYCHWEQSCYTCTLIFIYVWSLKRGGKCKMHTRVKEGASREARGEHEVLQLCFCPGKKKVWRGHSSLGEDRRLKQEDRVFCTVSAWNSSVTSTWSLMDYNIIMPCTPADWALQRAAHFYTQHHQRGCDRWTCKSLTTVKCWWSVQGNAGLQGTCTPHTDTE